MTRQPPSRVYAEKGSIFDTFRTPIRELSLCSEFSADKEALELARKFVNFVLQNKFWIGSAHGNFAPDSHFHAHLSTLWALLEYARVAEDNRLMNFVREGHDYARTIGMSRVGCLHQQTEVCASHDMIALTITLSELRIDDYWKHVGQCVRNK